MTTRRSTRMYTVLTLIGLAILLIWPSFVQAVPLTAAQQVQASWNLASDLARYDYQTDLTQTIHPTNKLVNLGRQSRKEHIQISGYTDRLNEQFYMKLDGKQALEMKVEDGQSYGRAVGSDQWELLEEQQQAASDMFAPNGDPLGFLAAADNVQIVPNQSAEAQSGLDEFLNPAYDQPYTLYSFEVNGPRYAEHMRQLLTEQLRAQGELPAGVTVGLADVYLDMTGHGQLWISEEGLPLRLETHLEFPATMDEARDWVSAEFTTNFSNLQKAETLGEQVMFGMQRIYNQPSDAFRVSYSLLPKPNADFVLLLGLSLLLAGFVALMVTDSHSRKVYTAVALSVIFSMVFSPLMQGHQVSAYVDQQSARQMEHAQAQALQAEQEAAQADLMGEAFDPRLDPLAETATDEVSAISEEPAETTVTALQTTSSDDDDDEIDDTLYCDETDETNGDEDGDGLDDNVECYELGTWATIADSDGDLISDLVEVEGVTVENDATGTRWYLNPLHPDSNGDGLLDSAECSDLESIDEDGLVTDPTDTECPDTDSDGVPDLFDFDNDGDGVPDTVDGSPYYYNTATTTAQSELNYGLSDYTTGKSIEVKFEIRPTHQDHLYQSYNVLEWPTDTEGQITRVLTTTWADEGYDSDSTGDNGNLMLSPMLEITLPAPEDNSTNPSGGLPVWITYTNSITNSTPLTDWLDTDMLDEYSIEVSQDADTGELYVYLPLFQLEDDNGGAPVAWTTQMYYRPEVASWGDNHTVKMVWLVNALVDTCDTTDLEDDDDYEEWCSADNPDNWVSESRMIQTYYEEFYLTGFYVKEDLGFDAAIISQNDALSQDYAADLWALSYGLQLSFSEGITLTNGSRFDLDEVYDRFGLNNATGDEDWNLDPTNFSIVKNDYEDGITGMVDMADNQIPSVLDSYGASADDIVNLLIASEEHIRTTDLDADDISATTSGALVTLAVDMSELLTQTHTNLSFNPYQYTGSDWAGVDYGDYVTDELGDRLDRAFSESDLETWYTDLGAEYDDLTTEKAGVIAFAKNYYLDLGYGVANVVALDGEILTEFSLDDADLDLTTYPAVLLVSMPQIIQFQAEAKLLGKTTLDEIYEVLQFWSEIYSVLEGGGDVGDLPNVQSSAIQDWLALVEQEAYKLLQASEFIEGIAYEIVPSSAFGVTLGLGHGTMNVVFKALAAISWNSSVYDISKEGLSRRYEQAKRVKEATKKKLQSLKRIKQIDYPTYQAKLKTAVAKYKMTKWSIDHNVKVLKAKVKYYYTTRGLIADVAAATAMLIYTVVDNNISASSLAFTALLANFIAEVIVAIIVAVISATVVGAFVLAVIYLIDAVIMLICTIIEASSGINISDDVQTWVCGGIMGAFTELVTYLIYDQTPLADLTKKNRLDFNISDVALSDEVDGFVVGNSLQLSGVVTTSLYFNEPKNLGWSYWYQYSDDYLKETEFAYHIQESETDLSVSQPDWDDTSNNESNPYYIPDDKQAEATIDLVSDDLTFTTAGVNATFEELYFTESFKMNAQECWNAAGVIVCYLRNYRDNFHNDVRENFVFDILPATFDGFVDLAATDAGVRLSWDTQFPILDDADGDGLPREIDPDDADPDSDNDGLSDYWEYENGSSIVEHDADCDGLTDYWENFYGTNSNLADTDGDGLPDGLEVYHPAYIDPYNNSGNLVECQNDGLDTWIGGWEIVYDYDENATSQKRTRVNANPLTSDGDGDNIFDRYERVYGYNPNVAEALNVLSIEAELEASVVAPNSTLPFTATIKNELDSEYASGLLEGEHPLDTVQVSTVFDTLAPRESVSLNDSLSIDLSSTQATSVSLRAGAIIENIIEDKFVWLKLNEAAGSTSFADSSLNGNDAGCWGDCPTANGSYLDFSPNTTSGLQVNANMNDDSFTVAFWVYPLSSGTAQLFLSVGNGSASRIEINQHANNVQVEIDNDTISAGTGLTTDIWSHIALTIDSDTAALYVNGTLVDTLDDPNIADDDARDFYFGDSSGLNDIDGYLDDVRIYNSALSEAQVNSLVGIPVLDIDMNNVGSYEDSSSWDIDVTSDDNAPSSSNTGAQFAQFDYLEVEGTGVDLKDNQFTFSAWIYPQARNYAFYAEAKDEAFTYKDSEYDWQGVFGRETAGEGNDGVYTSDTVNYPSLYISDEGHIRFRINTNNGTCVYQTSEPHLTYGSWQYLTITYDGAAANEWNTYIDGVSVDTSDNSSFPCSGNNYNLRTEDSFYIGRPNPYAYLYVDRVRHTNNFGYNIKLEYDGSRFWDKEPLSTYTTYDVQEGFLIDDEDEHTIKVYGDTLLDGYRRDHTESIYWTSLTNGTDSEEVSSYYGDADFFWSVSNDYFRGKLDDFQLYNYAMSADDVELLYGTNYLALDMPFDEPPGTDVFGDDSGNELEAVCDSANGSCPDSGLAGRDNQALRFDRDEGHYVQIASHGFDESLADKFTAGLWFKLTEDTGSAQRLIHQTDGSSGTGRVWLGIDADRYLYTYIQGSTMDISSQQIELDKWYYGAISYDDDAVALGLYDGTTIRQTQRPGAAQLTDGAIYLGANKTLASSNFFNGWMDDLTIQRIGYDTDAADLAELIEALVVEAPVLNLHLDESVETTTFTDDSPYANNPTCTNCPETGVSGRMRETPVFQGSEFLLLDNVSGDEWGLETYTLSAWVNPHQTIGSAQDIIYKLNNDGSYSFRLHLRSDLSPRVRVDSACSSTARATGSNGLAEDQWSHLVATYDGTDLVLYVNGSEVETTSGVAECSSSTNTDIVIGENFVGNLDEVAIYGRPMTSDEVDALYEYQSAWYDIAEEFTIQVDDDAPVISGFADGEYIAVQTDIQLGVSAVDSLAGLASLTYSINGGTAQSIDLTSQASGGYGFTFTPSSGDGTYSVDFTAVDKVGNSSSYSGQITVDNTAGSATLTDPGTIQIPTNGVITLDGTVSDSGVAVDDIQVWVAVYDGLGNAVSGYEPATVTAMDTANGTWTVNYPFGNAPYGTYTVKLMVEDRLGNNSGEVEAGTITLDGYGPVGDILLDTDALTDTTTISGVVSDPLYPTNSRVVHFHFEENAGATEFVDSSGNFFHASCSASTSSGICPTAGQSGQFGNAVGFSNLSNLVVSSAELTTSLDADNSDQTFMAWVSHNGSGTPDQIVNNSNSTIGWALRLNTSSQPIVNVADDTNSWTLRGDALEANRWYHLAGVIDRTDDEIRLYVDGQLVASESAEVGTLDGGDGLLIIGSNVNGGSNFDGLLDEVVVYNSALSEQTLYQIANPTGATVSSVQARYRHASNSVWSSFDASDIALYLPLDSNTPTDVSSNGYSVSCNTCPTFAQEGKYGNAPDFDGEDDYLQTDYTINEELEEITMAAWFKLDEFEYLNFILAPEAGKYLGWMGVYEKYSSAGNTYVPYASIDETLLGTTALNTGQWYHIALSFDGTTTSLYLDGALEASVADSFGLAFDQELRIGTNQNAHYFFDGSIDEVTIFERALSQDEIIALSSYAPWEDVTLDTSNANFTTWSSTVPSDLADGPYQIDLLATDSLGNVSTMLGLWNGEIDTQAPELTFSSTDLGNGYIDVTCAATDFNIDETSWDCPVGGTPTAIYSDEDEDYDWYTELFTDTSQLVGLTESGTVASVSDFTACDSYGHCATASQASSRSSGNTLTTFSRILTPTTEVFTSLQAIDVGGIVSSNDGIQSLSVTANGQTIHSETWPSNPSEATWTTNWTPDSEGAYDLVATLTTAISETVSGTATLYVDLTDPTVSIATSQFNQANVRGNRLIVTGTANDATALARLEAKVDEGPWRLVPLTGGTTYTATVAVNGRLTADSYDITVRATDHAGRTASSSQTIPFDLSPPTGLELTLQAEGQRYRPGQTIVASTPAVVVSWNTSDAESYEVEWLNNGTTVASETLAGSASEHSYQASEGKLTVRVTATDAEGNTSSRTYGPIFVDDATTPVLQDLTAFAGSNPPYEGWLTNGCTLLGIDHRRAQATTDAGSFNRPQQLHTSWNSDGLRLAWQGADWRTQGDLFIYLDTVDDSGATTAYNPFDSTNQVTVVLPTDLNNNSFTADYLVWVRETPITETVTVEDDFGGTETFTQTVQLGAVLLQWDGDGEAWQEVDGEFGYRLDTQRPSPLTDIYLPFNLLGISDPANQSLGLVAFASEEEQLKLWATLPAANNLNSEAVVNKAVTSEVESFALINQYQWNQLGDGICPNQDGADDLALYNGADLSVSLQSDPAGVGYSVFDDQMIFAHRKLFASAADWTAIDNQACADWWADPDRPADAPPPLACRPLKSDTSTRMHPRRDLRRLMNTDTDYLSDEDEINLTITIANNGTATAHQVRGQLTSPGQLRFADGEVVITPAGEQVHRLILEVGELLAGQSRTFNIPAQVDTSFNADSSHGWTHVKLLVFDETGSRRRPNHQLHLDHPLDTEGPTAVELTNPTNLVKPGQTTFAGVVIDDSPVPTVLVEVGGSQTTCSDSTPADSSWTCEFTIPDGADGQSISTRLKAIDVHGQESDWFDGPTLILDTSAPVLTATDVLTGTLGDGLIGPNDVALVGTLSDNRFAHDVVVCQGETVETQSCASATVLLDATTVPTTTYVYRDEPALSIVVGSNNTCPNELLRSINVTDSFIIADLDVGLLMEYDNRNDAVAWLTSPNGTRKEIVSHGGNVANLNVLLDDAASISHYVDDDQSDHTIDSPFFANVRRPYRDQLADFRGENAQGTWLLGLCDHYDDEDEGLYYRSELRFTAQVDYTGTVGTWQHRLSLPANQEAITRTVSVYGVDQAGNESDPIDFTVSIDTKSPVLTVTTTSPFSSTGASLTGPLTLAGTVSDANLDLMRLTARTPNGQFIRDRIPVSGQTWQYSDRTTFNRPGLYCIWVEAEDSANNQEVSQAYALQVEIKQEVSISQIYLPLITRELTLTSTRQRDNDGQHRIFLPLIADGISTSQNNDLPNVSRYFVDPAVCR